MTNKNIVVTGGAGFIGLNFVKYLQSVEEFTGKIIIVDSLTYAANVSEFYNIVDNKKIYGVGIDICNSKEIDKAIKKYDIDLIINFAADSHVDNSIKDSTKFVVSNVVGVQVLLEVCKKYKLKFVQISTDEVFGSVNEPAIPGITRYNPSNPYAASKAGANHLVRSYGKTHGLDYLITYCTNNYGPYQHEEKFIPVIIKNLLKGTKVPVYGFGGNARDWLYVEDHCKALYSAISTKFYNTNSIIQIPKSVAIAGHNTCTNIALVKELIDIICPEKEYKDCIKNVKDRLAHDTQYLLDDRWTRKILLWQPETSFKEGLEKTVEFYKENGK